MNSQHPRRTSSAWTTLLASLLLLISSLLTASGASGMSSASAQREHLTATEIEQVRENQELDRRTEVFIKAAERRMQILSGQKPAALSKREQKQAQRDAETLGDMPAGTRPQLLSDIAKILDEAIVNIDDAAIHSAKSSLIPKSLRKLADAAARLLPQFAAMRDTAQETAERESLELAIENAQSIVEAAKKLAPETKKQ